MNAELKAAIEGLETALSDSISTFREDDKTTAITGERQEAWGAALAEFRRVKSFTDEPYITNDKLGGFESTLAAAHYFEDRFHQIRIVHAGLRVAMQKQDLEGVKFFLSQLDLLTQAVEGMHEDPRNKPEEQA